MNYKKIYKNLILNAKSKNRIKNKGIYYESHHIIPDFMFYNRKRKGPKGHLPGNPNSKNNLVLLTAREHILSHLLLVKILCGKRYWASAASAMNWFYIKVIGEHPRQKSEVYIIMKKYERYRNLGIAGISAARKGTFPAKDYITGESVGSVRCDDPKVLSGEWVHRTKGRIMPQSEKDSRPNNKGKTNSNSREIDIEYIKEMMIKYSTIVKEEYDNNFIAKYFCTWFDSIEHKPYCTFTHSKKEINQPISGMSGKFLNLSLLANELIPITNWNVPRYGMGAKYNKPKPFIWVTDGKTSIQINDNIIPDGFKRGRTLRDKN